MIPFWILAMGLYYFFRFYGLDQTPGISVGNESPIAAASGLTHISVGIVAALVYTLVEYVGGLHFVKQRSYGIVLLTKILAAFFLILFISYLVASYIAPFEIADTVKILRFKPFWALLLYFTMMSALASFIRLMIQKIGKGPFIRLLLGRYRKPKKENRVFLFLDLKSSVQYAQKLGHSTYSRLIQECFFDLDISVNRYQGEIYQYIGDAAVVTWSFTSALQNNNCVRCFLSFQKRIKQRRNFYLTNFEFVPVFKAGLHGGSLTVAEVGGEKKEIAYYGDVINTASRIQQACTSLGEQFLISAELAVKMPKINYRSVGPVELKGREKSIELVTLPVT
ncbi:MAG: adenylate/guanylate cyclase domain-containing protein [Saprospiraceae bacterium]|nr:adenylate/guanylate cyclase domain-containing protein [Saprospiraceae bacterium]